MAGQPQDELPNNVDNANEEAPGNNGDDRQAPDADADTQPGPMARLLSAPLSVGNGLVVLVIVGAIVVLITLAIGPTREGSKTGIDSADYARGLITLIFSGGTMLIAVLLALYVITSDSPQASDRFTRGKEVLTILIGVFGTILGFYFGKTDVTPPTPTSTQQTAPADGNAGTPKPDNPKPDDNPDKPKPDEGGGS